MQLPEKQAVREFENLLPLVNVVFLLLIFFMVAGAFNSPDPFSIDPTIAENDNIADSKTLTILMSDQGEFAVENQIVAVNELILIIQQNLQNQSLQRVQLKPDANADAVIVVELLERLGETELEAIHILTSAPTS